MKDLERYQMLVEDVCEDHDCLSQKQRSALGFLLWESFTKKSTDYKAVVNYLYKAEEIDLMTGFELLNLA